MTLDDYVDMVMTYVEKNLYTMQILNNGTFIEPYLNATWEMSPTDFKITTPQGTVLTKSCITAAHTLQDIGKIAEWVAHAVNNPKLVQAHQAFQKELDIYAGEHPIELREALEEHESRKDY